MAAGHKFTDAVHHVVLGVAILLVGLVVVERQLPVQDLLELEELPPKVQAWRQKGELVDIYGNKMFVVQAGQDKSLDVDDAIVFFHGFPTSSFDYDKSLPDLIKEFPKKKLVFFDHIGFGFSDKPQEDYEFTLHDHAENALALMRQLKIKSAHIVAHDMGDSVLTEILLRRHLKLLPDYFNTFFKSVTFTNGGMHYDLINFRLSQRLLSLPYLGAFLSSLNSKIPESISGKISTQQLASIWSPNSDEEARNQDIEAITSLIRFNGGMTIAHKTISYLKDRARFESRWYRALEQLDIPCMLLWGDSDSVAPMEIPKYLAGNVIPTKMFTGRYLKDTGHFLMLEKPLAWSKMLADFIKK